MREKKKKKKKMMVLFSSWAVRSAVTILGKKNVILVGKGYVFTSLLINAVISV